MANLNLLFKKESLRKYKELLIIFTLLFAARFYLSTLFFNNDIYNFLTWVVSINDKGFMGLYERDFSPWAQANYPPVLNYLYFLCDKLGHFIFGSNIPMNILASFYKLPSMIAETFLAAYLFTRRQKLVALVILLNPAIWYNTMFWGETDGIVASVGFLSILILTNNKIILGLLLYSLALLIKQPAVIYLPVIGLYIFKKATVKSFLIGVILSVVFIWVSFLPLNNQNPLIYPITFYLQTLSLPPYQHLGSVNAFNFWYLLGFNLMSDDTTYFLTINQWGLVLAFIFVVILLVKFFKQKHIDMLQVSTVIGLCNFAIFLFLTRVHERYIFPALIFLIPLAIKNKVNFIPYSIISIISFIDLFWVWHFDHQLNTTIYLNELTTKLLALINIVCFAYLLIIFLISKQEK